MTEQADSSSVVAIDLGSNSFHLLEAELDIEGNLKPLTMLAQKVQLGLDMKDGQLRPEAIQRGLDCLASYRRHSSGRLATRVRVVGTQALRLAKNQQAFLLPAEALLGQAIEVISGEEEAALAYAGVVTALTPTQEDESRLVVDIGGGSTELALGQGELLQQAESLQVGCVSWLSYFPDGRITQDYLNQARRAAAEQFDAVAERLSAVRPLAIGCSGTLLAVEQVLIQQGWSRRGITRQGLQQLEQALLGFERLSEVQFHGLLEDRRSIFASGLAIVMALFDSLQLDTMMLSQAGLREGIAWRLLHSQEATH